VVGPVVHALLELDSSGWGPLAFSAPVAVIEARSVAEVLPAIRAAEAAARAGRWVVGYVAYEAAPAFDAALRVRPGEGTLAWFGVHDAPLGVPPPGRDDARLAGVAPELDAAAHGVAVEAIRQGIAAGAVYQVNFTFRLEGKLDGDPLDLYRRLRGAQGSGDSAYVRTGSRAIVSASPELFLLRQGDRVTARPMKGTARRGRWPEEDEGVRLRLAASEKDRAENVMIADLLRNDLGRVAVTGSVTAGPLLEVERLRTVWQLTSTVSARLRPGADLADLFSATFPCGSVTGAPKVAAMRLVADLERSPRGPYCGAVGAIAPGGDACFNVAIRTAEVDLATGAATYGTGGGITWDSDPAAEWDEALAKTRVLDLAPGAPTLLETMRLEGGRVALLEGHLARLAGSARYHAIPVDLAAVRERIAEEQGDARLRLLLDPSGAIALERASLPAPVAEPVPVALCGDPVDRRDASLFHKSTRREPYDRRRATRPQAFEVLLVNREGELTEGTFTNVVVDLDGERFTPPLDAGLLPGVFRAGLLSRGEVRERRLLPADLSRARRVWLVNALRGWIEAHLVP
jgi:para-aminobenzoate synthetase/4-amino-4-deoxychorismate lyase